MIADDVLGHLAKPVSSERVVNGHVVALGFSPITSRQQSGDLFLQHRYTIVSCRTIGARRQRGTGVILDRRHIALGDSLGLDRAPTESPDTICAAGEYIGVVAEVTDQRPLAILYI